MPHVVNGIGTWYYGKKNPQARQGVCQQCHQSATLNSYDTRLWFVVLFIPIIPLGRKRIMDECSQCKRHYAADKDKYEMNKQLSISGAQDAYRENPTADNAMQVHAQFLGFHQHEEARQFRDIALQQFPQSADLRAVLALHLEQMGDYGGAGLLYEQAHQLRPDLPEARIGVARLRMGAGQLDEARRLLDFLEEPGAGQLHSLEALDQLAGAYQVKNQHPEALDLCRVLIREYPKVVEHHQFRKFVLKSEKAVGATESLLPQVGFSLRGLFDSKSGRYSSGTRWLVFGCLALALAGAGTIGLSEYRKAHRSVTVINLWNEPALISVDGGPAMPRLNLSRIEMAEGTHQIAISGPVTDAFNVTLETGFFERLFKDPVWCINVGSAAAFQISTVHYAVAPRPSENMYSVGEQFLFVPDVDFVFTAPPPTMKVDSKGGEITKVALELSNEPALSLYRYVSGAEDQASAERFVQSRIRMAPQIMELMAAYMSAVAADSAAEQRAVQFFQAGLWQQPLSINWHRCYSSLLERHQPDAEVMLAKLYDERLAQTPNDATLLYLRGRVAPSHAESIRFFELSSQADEKLAWPYMGLSWFPLCNANWETANQLMERATLMGLQDETLNSNRHFVLLGLKDYAPLEQQYREKLKRPDVFGNAESLINLCDVLVVQGREAEAKQAVAAELNKIPPEFRRPELNSFFEKPLKYLVGEFATPDAAAAPAAADAPLNDWDFHEWLLNGRAEQVAQDARFARILKEAWNQLALSNAFYIAGNPQAASQWRDRACEVFEKGGHDEQRSAALLRGQQPATSEALNEIALPPRVKAQVVAALTWIDPERRTQLAAFARQLNVSRIPPHRLVEAVLAKVAP